MVDFKTSFRGKWGTSLTITRYIKLTFLWKQRKEEDLANKFAAK